MKRDDNKKYKKKKEKLIAFSIFRSTDTSMRLQIEKENRCRRNRSSGKLSVTLNLIIDYVLFIVSEIECTLVLFFFNALIIEMRCFSCKMDLFPVFHKEFEASYENFIRQFVKFKLKFYLLK